MIPIFIALLLAQVPDQHHPPRSAEEYAKVLEASSRDVWQKPHEVIAALKLRPDEVVADIGAGSGYFTRRLARHAGKVYAVDIDPKLLEMTVQDKAPNIEPVLGAADDPKLPPASIDTVFICDVWHHIAQRREYLKKLTSALKPGGRIVMIDFHKRPLPVGPPVGMKITEDEVTAELKAAGFRPARRHGFLPHQYFVEYVR